MIAMAGPVAEMIVCPDSSTDRHHRRDKLQAFSAAIGLTTGILPGDDVAAVSAAFEHLDAAARANVLRIVDRLTASCREVDPHSTDQVMEFAHAADVVEGEDAAKSVAMPKAAEPAPRTQP